MASLMPKLKKAYRTQYHRTFTPLAFPHEVWERTPSEAQAYMRALEARVEVLEAMVQAF